MEPLGPAPASPSMEELIVSLGPAIAKVMSENPDEIDIDRVWVLRKIHKSYLYYRDLAYFAPALFAGLNDITGINGQMLPDAAADGTGLYDYTQNYFKGYCRKLCGVLGVRIPNAIAVPDDANNEQDVAAARAANDAAEYIRKTCELQVLTLYTIFKEFNFGTAFFNIEWNVDPDKYGWKDVPQTPLQGMQTLGGQNGVPSFDVPVPEQVPPKRVAKGRLEIDVLDASEISVPLDTDSRKGTEEMWKIRRERERYKGVLLRRFGDVLRQPGKEDVDFSSNVASQYGRSVRSAMASPIGIVRPERENFWTELTEDWTPAQMEMIDDPQARELILREFPEGVRIVIAKGRIVKLEKLVLRDHWVAVQPEPGQRVQADPLGDDWIVSQDILNNTLNQQNETIERSNEPGFADPTRVNLEAYKRRRSEPLDLIPAIPPAGRSIADIIHRPDPPRHSDQIVPFRAQVEMTAKENSGLTDAVTGAGASEDPTARQTELKTNAAIRQLSVTWMLLGKALEKVYEKGCKLLAEHEDGVLAFSRQKQNSFGKFDSVSVVIADLKGGNYHFQADEAIPMTWGQQRDLTMWLLGQPPTVLESLGFHDPMNVFSIAQLLGIGNLRVPHLAERDKGMDIISRLLEGTPQPGQPDPQTGETGPLQPSILPDWEDDPQFMAQLVRAYLTDNYDLAESAPKAYQNVQLYGQACEERANQAPPPAPPKTSVGVSLKGGDLGDPAVQDALSRAGLIGPGTQVQAVQPEPKLGPLVGGPAQRMSPPNGVTQ